MTRSRRTEKLKAYLRLCRPANLPTAAADVLAGAAVAAYSLSDSLAWHTVLPAWYIAALAVISVLLYAAGVVLNDYYDREIDAVERPERPIPSGVVKSEEVLVFGWSLALLALGLAAWLDLRVLGWALLLLGCIWFYDYRAKRNNFWGPFFMGVCRALNLLLGMSPLWTIEKSGFALVPLIYIFAVTTVSRGEVHGGEKGALRASFGLYLLSLLILSGLLMYFNRLGPVVITGILAFGAWVSYPLYQAHRDPQPGRIRKAVKTGVLSLVLLDAVLGGAFGGWSWALVILSMSGVSLLLSRFFLVT